MFFCSVSAGGPFRWLDDSAPAVDVMDETSRDSGICLMDDDTPSIDHDAHYEFSVSTLTLWRLPYVFTAIKHPVPDRVKRSFLIFDIRTLWRSALSVRVSGCQKLEMTA